jgi:hypothetical protein
VIAMTIPIDELEAIQLAEDVARGWKGDFIVPLSLYEVFFVAQREARAILLEDEETKPIGKTWPVAMETQR